MPSSLLNVCDGRLCVPDPVYKLQVANEGVTRPFANVKKPDCPIERALDPFVRNTMLSAASMTVDDFVSVIFARAPIEAPIWKL